MRIGQCTMIGRHGVPRRKPAGSDSKQARTDARKEHFTRCQAPYTLRVIHSLQGALQDRRASRLHRCPAPVSMAPGASRAHQCRQEGTLVVVDGTSEGCSQGGCRRPLRAPIGPASADLHVEPAGARSQLQVWPRSHSQDLEAWRRERAKARGAKAARQRLSTNCM